MRNGTPAERFWRKVSKGDTPDSCWAWLGTPRRNGYGQINDGHRQVYVHRFAYELLAGPIPDGLTIDHLCRNKLCVNPAHMEPVTNAENIRRMIPHRNTQRTHCSQGHALDGDNAVPKHPGQWGRQCRVCGDRRTREYRARKRQASTT